MVVPFNYATKAENIGLFGLLMGVGDPAETLVEWNATGV